MRDWLMNRIQGINKQDRSGQMSRGQKRRIKSARSGQSLILIAVAFMGVVAFLGFAIDTGIIYLNRIWLGQAVDAAALAAGFELPDIQAACSRAVEFLAENGYVANGDFYFTITFPEEINGPGGSVDELVLDSITHDLDAPVKCASVTGGSVDQETKHYHVQISAEMTLPVVFMRVLGFDTIGVGIPATAKRTTIFDVVLVMDTSISMNKDTCHWHQSYYDESGGAKYYGCENAYKCGSTYIAERFDDPSIYITPSVAEMESDRWDVEYHDAVDIGPAYNRGSSGVNYGVRLFYNNDPTQPPPDVDQYGAIDGTFDLSGFSSDQLDNREYVGLFFHILNDPTTAPSNQDIDGNARVIVSWQSSATSGWNTLMTISPSDISTSEWTRFGVILNATNMYKSDFEVRFELNDMVNDEFEGVYIDDIEIVNCPHEGGQYSPSHIYTSGCSWLYAKTCDTAVVTGAFADHADNPQPGVSEDSSGLPSVQVMEQPMTDVIRGGVTFVNMLEARFLISGLPERQDQIGVVQFYTRGDVILNLTNDYDAVIDALWKLHFAGNTNIGGGLRYGLDELNANGRPQATHFIVLLSDGWMSAKEIPSAGCPSSPCTDPDYFDPPSNEAYACPGGDVTCDGCYPAVLAMIEKAVNQNVTVYTIGLGTKMEQNWTADEVTKTAGALLAEIAHGTTGEYFYAEDTTELDEIFEWIAEAIFVRLTL